MPPTPDELIKQLSGLALSISADAIDAFADALADDGRISGWEYGQLIWAIGRGAMLLVPSLQQAMAADIDLHELAEGFRQTTLDIED